MQSFIDFLNDNPGIVALLGVVLGWFLSTMSSERAYKRQKRDERSKEYRECFRNKAELVISNDLSDNRGVEVLNVILCPYDVGLEDDGRIYTKIPDEYLDINNLKKTTIRFSNIGKADINELEIATADPKNIMLLDVNLMGKKVNSDYVGYGSILDKKVRVGRSFTLNIYYSEDKPINDYFFASIEIYYRDSLNNVCAQSLFVGNRKIYEPRLIEYSEWREQVSVDKNLDYWLERLTIARGKNKR